MNGFSVEEHWSRSFRAATIGVAALLAACAQLSPVAPAASPEAGCERFYAELDELTDRAGARDAGAERLAAAPYLRVDRSLASFATERLAPSARADWLERLRRVDARARRVELANLGPRAAGAVYSPYPGLDANAVVAECGRRLLVRDLSDPVRTARLQAAPAVPDVYRTWQRLLGVYPVMRVAMEQGIAQLHRRLRARFARPPSELPGHGRLLRYAPAGAVALPPAALQRLLARVSQNPLTLPDPQAEERRQLFESFAPVWEVDTVSDSDRIGAVAWRNDGSPAVRVDAPAVYRFVTHTRFNGASLLQLNYLVWFPSRPAQHWLDIHAGELDGLIWRVTLTREGVPLAYDSIHPCGFYYQVFPWLGYRVQQPSSEHEPVLSPSPLLPPRMGQRLVIRISAAEHYLEAVYPDSEAGAAQYYGWHEYEELLMLRHPAGGRRSLFGPDGLIGRTGRLERFLLWPSGIMKPGAMRRIGTHAIALIGRRHFDDADLLESLLRPL